MAKTGGTSTSDWLGKDRLYTIRPLLICRETASPVFQKAQWHFNLILANSSSVASLVSAELQMKSSHSSLFQDDHSF